MRPGSRWRTAAVLAWAAWGVAAAAEPAGRPRVALVLDPARSEVRFRAEATGHAFTGRTRRIGGRATLAPGDLSGVAGASAEVEAASLETGNGLRDRKMRRMLESDRYPRILFRAARFAPGDLPREGGKEFRGVLSGEITVRGVTTPVSFDVAGAWEGAGLRASGAGEVRFTDFGMKPPRVLGWLRVEDRIRLEFDVLVRPAEGSRGAPAR